MSAVRTRCRRRTSNEQLTQAELCAGVMCQSTGRLCPAEQPHCCRTGCGTAPARLARVCASAQPQSCQQQAQRAAASQLQAGCTTDDCAARAAEQRAAATGSQAPTRQQQQGLSPHRRQLQTPQEHAEACRPCYGDSASRHHRGKCHFCSTVQQICQVVARLNIPASFASAGSVLMPCQA